MPWQQFVADVATEYDPRTLIPYYREVGVSIHRQAGKTTEFLTWECDRALNWGRPQRIAFTAQSGKDARDKHIDEIFPMLKRSGLAPAIAQINEGMGNESIRWRNGSIIRLLSTSTSSGHSKTLDLAVEDEIWADSDDRREQALRPALITREDAQLLWCSTAGTQESVVLNRKRNLGREAVRVDAGYGIAYFEWSAPDDWDPEDEQSYFAFMPALCPDPPCRCGQAEGWTHTITLDALRLERQAMEPMEFQRAYGNRTTSASDALILPDVWAKVCDPGAKPSGALRFALDVDEDRAHAAIVVSDGRVCELVEHRAGTEWLVPRANELSAKHHAPITIDATGPAGSFVPALRDARRIGRSEVFDACERMFDAIAQQQVTFRQHPGFDAAAAGVAKRQFGDRWTFSRRSSSADITPLVAATLALDVGEPASLMTF